VSAPRGDAAGARPSRPNAATSLELRDPGPRDAATSSGLRAPERFDAVIAGGGLAGLSLAAHLAAGGWRDRSVLLVDDVSGPDSPGPDVGWGFWSARPGLLDATVSARYERARIHAGDTSRVLSLSPYSYQVVHRADLHRVVIDMLAKCPRFTVRQGRISGIRDRGATAEATVDGQPVRATWLFDSTGESAGVLGQALDDRSAGPATGDRSAGRARDARQVFTGWEVRCPNSVFDPQTPTLFDFRTQQFDTSRFIYVLPRDPHRALAELVEFIPRRRVASAAGGATSHAEALAGYLRGVLGVHEYEILRVESGVLPLRTRPVRRRYGRVLTIGARAGLVKASTGYAYQRIQRDSEAIAESLARCGHPFRIPAPPRRYRLLDATLLEVLYQDPAQLEQSFARLFKANSVARALRFLDEESSVPADLRLMTSMPPAPHLRALAAQFWTAAQIRP
jgi:lycopene beta-cyclase